MAETLEAQANAVRNAARGRASSRDRQVLLAAQETLEDMAKLRRKILDSVGKTDEAELSDDLSHEFVRILSLPTSE